MAERIEFEFECVDWPEAGFEVAAFSGSEGVSQLYRFDIDLVVAAEAGRDDIEVDDLHGQSGRLTLRRGARERNIQGVIGEVEVLGHAEAHTVYRVTLVPRVWHLESSSANAVYLDRTTPEVIRGLLEERAGITTADQVDQLAREYRRWPFRLQYGETDWSFIAWLMERDGVYYYFVPGDDGELLALCDRTGNQPTIEDPTLAFTANLGLEAGDAAEAVHSLVLHQQHVPRTVRLTNYNDERPSTPIEQTAEVDPKGAGQVSQYGQSVLDPDEAEALAAVRAEELACRKAVYHGESTVFRLAAGYRFDLSGHPRSRYDRDYQVLTVEHSGHDPDVCGRIGRQPAADTPVYENRFSALPADVQFRPQRTTERASMHGSLNALIDAEGDGQYAEVDGSGRYHIVFPFHQGFHAGDGREDAGKASHWLRLIQPYGGTSEGMHLPLRKGTRVLVTFVGGNPDLPVISGVLPNAEQPSVLRDTNLAKGTIRTAGGNLVELDDENPRIKFYSPYCRTYRHLGAPNAQGNIVDVTDGAARYVFLQGNNNVFSTVDWMVDGGEDFTSTTAVDFSLWGEFPMQKHRQSELGTLHLKDDVSDFGEWQVGDGIRYLYTFPEKIDPATTSDNADATVLGQFEEGNIDGGNNARDVALNNNLMVTRRTADSYAYNSGTDFVFEGPQRQVFDFGPMQSYVSDDHATGCDVLLGKARDGMPAAANASWSDSLLEQYRKKRWDFDLKLERIAQLEEAYILEQKYGKDVSVWSGPIEITENDIDTHDIRKTDNSGNLLAAYDLGHISPQEAPDVATYLTSYRARHKQTLDGKKIASPTQASDKSGDQWSGYNAGDETIDNDPAYLSESGTDPEDFLQSDMDTVDGFSSVYDSYESVIDATYGDPDDAADTGAYAVAERKRREYANSFAGGGLLNGRISVGLHDQFSYSGGRRYTYSVGPTYSETIVDLTGSIDNQRTDRLPKDLADAAGPEWSSISADVGSNWIPGEVNVSKTVGKTYTYTNGDSANVTVGDRHNVTVGESETTLRSDRIKEKTISRTDGKTLIDHEWEPKKQNTRVNNPHTGDLFSIHDVAWDSPNGRRTHDLNLGGRGSIALNAGGFIDVNINVGTHTSVNVPLVNQNDLKVGAGLIFELVACAGRIAVTQGDVASSFPGIKTNTEVSRLSNKVNRISGMVAEIETRTAGIEDQNVGIETGILGIMNRLEMHS